MNNKILNKTEQKRLYTAIKVLSDSSFEGTTLAKWIYQVAFSRSAALNGTPHDILEQVFIKNDEKSKASEVFGEEIPETETNLIDMTVLGNAGCLTEDKRGEKFDSSLFVIGDILISEKNNKDKMYIYDGKDFIELCCGEKPTISADSVSDAERYIVIRPSIGMAGLGYYPDEEKLELTLPQRAIVDTAYSYLIRGDRVQYDDSRLSSLGGEFRWQKALKQPEDYTLQEIGYINCAIFTYDVYYTALEYDIKAYTTYLLHNDKYTNRVYSFAKTGNETEEEKIKIQTEIKACLKPADIICIRREGRLSGHAMLYVGNETIIHSTGSSFDYSSSAETYEPTVRFRSLNDLFAEDTTCNIFGVVEFFDIIRPLDNWKGEISENTMQRIKNLKGIRAEKISSHPSSVTVNPGEQINYIFKIKNFNDYKATLEISDIIPENTVYISSNGVVSDNKITWRVEIPAEGEFNAEYTVKVKDNAKYGDYVSNNKGMVGSVSVKCPDTLIAPTLKSEAKEKIAEKIQKYNNSSYKGFALVDKIYSDILGNRAIFGKNNIDDVIDSLFINSALHEDGFMINNKSKYYKMMVRHLYGGRLFYSRLWENERTRLIKPHNLIAGDILIVKSKNENEAYLYDGERFFDLNSCVYDAKKATDRLEDVIAKKCFAVLRPSMIM